MICSTRWDGSTACMTIEGVTDTEVFRVYVRQVLCPTLRPGDVVIMDNLSPHKSVETLSLIQQLGAEVLFLPAYSPDLNPIEKMWSKLKEFLPFRCFVWVVLRLGNGWNGQDKFAGPVVGGGSEV